MTCPYSNVLRGDDTVTLVVEWTAPEELRRRQIDKRSVALRFWGAYDAAAETTMSEPEKTITELEAGFPALSGVAFTTARRETLASGQSTSTPATRPTCRI